MSAPIRRLASRATMRCLRLETDWLAREMVAVAKATATDRRMEAPLTNAVACMLHNDPAAAGRVGRIIVEVTRANAKHFRLPPKLLQCKPEHGFYRRVWSIDRRADLYFRSADGDYALVIECKLDAATGKHQLRDHLEASPKRFDSDLTGRHMYFGLVTSHAIVPRERTRSKRWLGAATWGELYDRLAEVHFEDTHRAERWRCVLEHYAPLWIGEVGDPFTSPGQLLDAAMPETLRRLHRDFPVTGVPRTVRGAIVRTSRSSAELRVRTGRVTVDVSLKRAAGEMTLTVSRAPSHRRLVPAERQPVAFQQQLQREIRKAILAR